MIKRIYVAAPIGEALNAERWAERIRKAGHVITSRWHSRIEGKLDPNDMSVRTAILNENLIDMHNANLCVAICSKGMPRATFSEIGWMLAKDKAVIWLENDLHEGGNIFDAHPLVFICTREEQVLQWIEKLSEK
jgi:nucleoside 2-deoxyribosyltransferase